MLCEMCGKDVELTQRVRIEGTILRLGPECVRFGEVVDPVPVVAPASAPSRASPPVSLEARLLPRARRLEERDLFREMPEMELAGDWPKRVRIAREKLAWTPEELGKRLNEKKSLVLKIEAGAFHPPDPMVRKIEMLLKIRLRAEPESPA
jgi:putative transcription factor